MTTTTTPPTSETPRPCTCHPDDDPPAPCPQKFAYHECMRAALADAQSRLLEAEAHYTGANRDFKTAQEVIDQERHRAKAAEQDRAELIEGLEWIAEPRLLKRTNEEMFDLCIRYEQKARALLTRMKKETGGHEIRRHTKQRPQCSTEAAESKLAQGVVVPREPTKKMLDAGVRAFQSCLSSGPDWRDDWRACYKAMLAAAPSQFNKAATASPSIKSNPATLSAQNTTVLGVEKK